MSHHGGHGDESDVLRRLFGSPEGLGATGEYPRGKLNPADEGEIKIAIAADPARGVVQIDFGKPVAWIGFTAAQALEIAESLQSKAREVLAR